MRTQVISGVVACAVAGAAFGQAGGEGKKPKPVIPMSPAEVKAKAGLAPGELPKVDLQNTPTLYVVGYAHLDTEWRWAYPQTIREYIADTLEDNFPLLEKYPNYVFNFSGSRRYLFMKEYYPEHYETLKKYISMGRWFPCGSSVDENDANVPNAESFVRHVLYGNKYFKDEFNVTSDEFMLPDCFGFPASMPTMLAHCGLKGFSTQKLTWGSPVGIPFKVGHWEGPDGRSVLCALDPGAYVGEVKENLATSEGWLKRIQSNGEKSGGKGKGVFADYHYFGTGDMGGAPKESSVAMVEKSATTAGPIKVVSGNADWMFKQISTEMGKDLPRYKGELLLTEHSAGSITSQAYMKRWNRKNEQLADAAERAAVLAWWLGAPYPGKKLEEAWYLVLGSQMHDILPGTSLPKAYEYAWNDEVLAGRMFADVLTDSIGAIASQMDTRADGDALVVYNPLSVARTDVVQFGVPLAMENGKAPALKVVVNGEEFPAQVIGTQEGFVHGIALVHAPAVSVTSVDVRTGEAGAKLDGALAVSATELSNSALKVTINERGDIASIFDKVNNRETLAEPIRLGLHYEKPREWPAWNMDWSDRQKPARSFVGEGKDAGTARITVEESGPVRVAIRIDREHEGSRYSQIVRLDAAAGDANEPWGVSGRSVEVETILDWNTRERSLKAAFGLTVANPVATYDLQVGVIERDNNSEKRYENPAHMWMDLTGPDKTYGVSILNDSKYGSDKPSDSMLRLTMVYTPGVRGGYQDQGTQDLGRHRMVYSVYPHAGDWASAHTAWHAQRLNQPLRAFNVAEHDGRMGRTLRLMQAEPKVMITAIKKHEKKDQVVVRGRELTGKAGNVKFSFDAGVRTAEEIDGQERRIGAAKGGRAGVEHPVRGFGLHAWGLELGGSPARVEEARVVSLPLTMDADVVSANGARADGAMEAGLAYPAEQWPSSVRWDGCTIDMPSAEGKNALVCAGQTIDLPDSGAGFIVLVGAATDGDREVTCAVDGQATTFTVHNWRGYIGQWDNRLWKGEVPEQAFAWKNELGGLVPGYIKDAPVAWYASHYHSAKQDEHYQYCYVYTYRLWKPAGAKKLTLPSDATVRVFAAVVSGGGYAPAAASTPLFDTLSDHTQDEPQIRASGPGSGERFTDATTVTLEPVLYWKDGQIRYTTDGSAPTAASAVSTGPLVLNATTTLAAAMDLGGGKMGPMVKRTVAIEDRTAPRVELVRAAYQSPVLHIEFSEPVDVGAASDAKNYQITPRMEVARVQVSGDGRGATLTLAEPPQTDKAYTLAITDVRDRAPSGNVMEARTLEFVARGPVYRLDKVGKEHVGATINVGSGGTGGAKIPTRGDRPFTMNMFVRMSKQPDNRTLIAGFGRCSPPAGGGGRYLAKFSGGIHMWSHNADVRTETPLDLNRWQMLTVTSDGQTVRIYKDAKLIGEEASSLSDDEPVVNIMPLDPWEKERRFDGEIRDFTIWESALDERSLKELLDRLGGNG